jgi:hypothetical protein
MYGFHPGYGLDWLRRLAAKRHHPFLQAKMSTAYVCETGGNRIGDDLRRVRELGNAGIQARWRSKSTCKHRRAEIAADQKTLNSDGLFR